MIRNYSLSAASEGERFVEVRTAEQLLIAATRDLTANRLLCTSLGRAQFAAEFIRHCPTAFVECFFLDLCQADLARQATGEVRERLDIRCEPDPSSGEFDLVAFPLSAQGDAEFTRELLQAGHQRLAMHRPMVVTTDNPDDAWLQSEMKKLFNKVSRRPMKKGVIYQATKTAPLKKIKNFGSQFAFRDRGRLIYVYSRPGVFSHRHLDLGARALIEAAEVSEGDRVLELGCGAGAVSLAAAMRAPNVHVTAVDSNPRALQCVRRGAELNGLTNVNTVLNADAEAGTATGFNVVLANPPYYSRFRISEIFLRGAERALRSGGVLQIVTKRPQSYQQRMPSGFRNPTTHPSRNYWIIRAIRK